MFAFAADRIIQRRQVALLSARAVPLEPKPAPRRDWRLFLFCAVVGGLIFVLLAHGGLGLVRHAAGPTTWRSTLKNYAFGDFDTDGWDAVLELGRAWRRGPR